MTNPVTTHSRCRGANPAACTRAGFRRIRPCRSVDDCQKQWQRGPPHRGSGGAGERHPCHQLTCPAPSTGGRPHRGRMRDARGAEMWGPPGVGGGPLPAVAPQSLCELTRHQVGETDPNPRWRLKNLKKRAGNVKKSGSAARPIADRGAHHPQCSHCSYCSYCPCCPCYRKVVR